MPINIAIDGTAGSGKGEIAKRISKKLGIYHLDTGAIFRSVAYKCLNSGISLTDEKSICKLIKGIDFCISFKNCNETQVQHNILDGEDLGDKIRTEEISEASSIISPYPCMREFAKSIQHEIASKYDIVIEGRDIGTVILPNADCKIFLTAKPEVRAERRLKQLNLPKSEYVRVLEEIKARDKRDMERENSPLKVAEDAHLIDVTNLNIAETVDAVMKFIKK